MCVPVPGWRQRILSGGLDPVEAAGDTPPPGFIRLNPRDSEGLVDDVDHARPTGGGVFTLVAMMTAGLAVVQTLVPWGLARIALQSGGVLAIFGVLGIWARRNRLRANRACPCDRPPVWIRVVPSIADPRRVPVRDQDSDAGPAEPQESLVSAGRVSR